MLDDAQNERPLQAVDQFSGSPKFVSLRDVVNHERFASLPLMRSKNVLTSSNKGREILELWKKNGDVFRNYAEGDARDVFLIFLNMFKLRKHLTTSTMSAK